MEQLRHSFVSLLSDNEVPIERISRLVGHSSTVTTETIYRKQIRPVIDRHMVGAGWADETCTSASANCSASSPASARPS